MRNIYQSRILIIFLAVFIGCGKNYHERLAEERSKYEQNISAEQKNLVNQFFIGVIATSHEFSGIDGGFFSPLQVLSPARLYIIQN